MTDDPLAVVNLTGFGGDELTRTIARAHHRLPECNLVHGGFAWAACPTNWFAGTSGHAPADCLLALQPSNP